MTQPYIDHPLQRERCGWCGDVALTTEINDNGGYCLSCDRQEDLTIILRTRDITPRQARSLYLYACTRMNDINEKDY